MFHKRLAEFIDTQRLTVRSFEKECNITQGVIAKSIQNETVLSGNNLIKIANRYPELDIDWLLTGKSEMLKSQNHDLQEQLEKVKEEKEYWKDWAETLKGLLKDQHDLP